MGTMWKVLTRKKVIDPDRAEETQLARRLNTFDLTALGVGSTLGVGVYVLAGQVAKSVAGPSVVLSFLIAAIASVFAGLCYAEFGARAPKAGSAYIYSYVCVGEFIAFIIGWNLILEYVIGSASVAKGLSLYLDTLINNTLQTTFKEIAPIDLPFMAKYFDFFSCGISILLAIALAFGLKESSLANNIFTTLNIGVVIFVVIAGSIKADTANWNYHPDNSTDPVIVGQGGFFPFGLEGTIKGAATCFYGFVGFDCIATTGEEVKNPKKAIPISIIVSLLIIFLAYFGISTVVTLMVPYYLQDANAPIPYAFEHIGWNWAKWVVSVGAIFGLCASLFGAMFPLPRIIYAMATDSLVFKILGRVSSRFQTPVIGTLLAGTLTGLMAALFDLKQLVNMMSIGTLMAYTIVAASVLLLRFSVDDDTVVYKPVRNRSDSEDSDSYTDDIATFTINNDTTNEDELLSYEHTSSSTIGQIFNCGRDCEPTKTSQFIVSVEVFLYCITCVLIGLSAIYLKHPIMNGDIWAIVLVSCIIFVAVILVMSIATQPVSRKELSFKVPMVPLIPALSILANIYLMLMLDYRTWIRFGVWMAIGLPTYYFSLRPIDEQQSEPTPIYKLSENHFEEKPTGLASYYTNNGFIDDFNNSETKLKKNKAPLPPKIEDNSETMEIEQELEKFDEMLDEVVNNLDKSNRKSSVSSLSMFVVLREENVVADVHCDVLTPAIPITSNTPLYTETIEPVEKQTEAPPSIIDLKQSPDDLLHSKKIFRRPVSFISTSGSEHEITEAVPFSINLAPTPPPSEQTSPILSLSQRIEEEVTNIPPPPPLPAELPLIQNYTPSNEKKNTRETLPRVTSNKIKEVTLRPTKKKSVDSEHKGFEPDGDNLKIGSDKAKTFINKLNNKLSIMSVPPTYIVPKKKGPAPLPPKHEKNENVIEESINRNEAKEKFGLFVNSRVSFIEPTKDNLEGKSSLEENSTQEENKSNLEKITTGTESSTEESEEKEESKNISEERITGTDNSTEESEDAYLAHKNRMKNVFRSMKSLDASKEASSSRNVKSLDLRHEEFKHRQAMNNVFDTILKESSQQQSKV